ncbi:MAG: prepilin-type N-terminal cleavage/methylation domain-containing protein [Verrucomicrobia subdivision 3 bacterium]|nr:prepilin-type N-terminal cleavage/methylation domain-containing protein [Limisphaerales bacterium]
MNFETPQPKKREAGFTLIELAIATVVLLFGVVAVMQLVPRAIQLNLDNRMNTTSTVTAQRLMDLMVNAGVNSPTLVDATGTFPCGGVNVCSLGAGAGVVGDFTNGSPLLPGGEVSFAAAPVPGFRLIYTDPNDPSGIPYDVRWAIVTSVRNVGPVASEVVAKRIVVGVRRQDGRDPVTLTSWITR